MSPHTHTNAKPEEAPETQHDAVFGEITSEGPNYRAVCLIHSLDVLMSLVYQLAVLIWSFYIGQLDGNRRFDYENANRSWCTVYSSCV